jgi:preprotein translocase subunit SecE
MNTKAETSPGALDTAKLIAAVAILLGGIVAYYWFDEASIVLRVLGLVASLVLGLAVAFTSALGQQVWTFIQGAQIEIRKVVWPTKQETLQTTLMVMVFAAALGVFFLVTDWLLLQFTRAITGQGG